MKLFTRIAGALALALISPAPAFAQTVLRSQTVSYDNIAALEAVPFARFQAGAAVIISESGRAGKFIKVTSNESALATADPDQCVFIASPQDATGASGGYVREDWLKDPDTVNVLWCGAQADFVTATQSGTDNASIFNNASALASGVIVPDGFYKLGSTWNINQVGATIKGGNRNTTGLYISHTNGCGVMLDGRLWEMHDLGIYSTDARWASTDYANDHQLCVGDPLDAPGGSLTTHTQSRLTRMNIFGGPGDGVHWIGTGSNSEISQSQISYNKRNGILLDDGSSDGFSSTSRNGIMNLNMLNLKDNGGYAIAATAPISGSGTAYRTIIDNAEIGNNAWNFATLNTAFPGEYVNANVYIRGQQVEVRTGGIGDTNWNGVSMESASSAGSADGNARCRHATATNYPTCTGGGKAAAGNEIYIDGASSQTKISQTRLLGPTADDTQDAVPPIYIAGSQESIIIENPYVTGTPDFVIETQNNVKGLVVMMGSNEVGDVSVGWNTAPIKVGGSATTGVVMMEGDVYTLTSDSTTIIPYLRRLPTVKNGTATIASGVATYNAQYLSLTPQGGSPGTDILDAVTGGHTGDLLVLQLADNNDTITINDRSGVTGEFWTNGDLTLEYVTDKAFFVYNSTSWDLVGTNFNFRPSLQGKAVNSVTIDSASDSDGVITVLGSVIEVDTESSAASDNLGCLVGGEIGDIIILHQTDNARDVIYLDAANLTGGCSVGAAMSLASSANRGSTPGGDLQDQLMLVKVSSTAWREVSWTDN